VVDDGRTPLSTDLANYVEYIRREPLRHEADTLTLNLATALPHIRGNKIFIIEDDDWYGPNYLKTMLEYLDNYVLVGEGFARYFNIRSLNYARLKNNKHISLCQTGFDSSLLSIFKKCLVGDPFVDMRFWNSVTENKYIFLMKKTNYIFIVR